MATTQLQQNAAGDWIEVPDAEILADGTVASVVTASTKLRKSSFRDDQSKDVYHDEIPVRDGIVYTRELDDDAHAAWVELQNELLAILETAKADEMRVAALKQQGKTGEIAALREKSIHATLALKPRNDAFTQSVIENNIAGWSFAREYSPTAFKQLRGEDQKKVLSEILSASGVGREEVSFLGATSALS